MEGPRMADDKVAALLERVAAGLEELVRWTRVTSFAQVRGLMQAEFGGEDEKARARAAIYVLTDGERTIREISDATGSVFGKSAVARMHARWRRMGIAALTDPDNRYSSTRALFDLRDFGIDVASFRQVPKPPAAPEELPDQGGINGSDADDGQLALIGREDAGQ
jgi:hypothetical protein